MKDSFSDALPSYSESIQSASPARPSLPASLARTRQNLLSALLTTHIHPHMHASALAGLAKTTLILVPSNVSALHPAPISPADSESYRNPFDDVGDGETFRGEKIIGFPSPENLSLIRLHGSENTTEFWRQAAVIRDLETQLKNELRAGGHRLVEDREDHSNDEGSRRHASVRSVEWRFAEEAAVEDGEIRVTIEVTEICLRVENVMGLYETRGGQALVVRVEVGG